MAPKAVKGLYYHYKNNKRFYRLIDVGRNTETEEWMIIYKPLYKSAFANLVIRPYKMFFDKVKDPTTGKSVSRFTRLSPRNLKKSIKKK